MIKNDVFIIVILFSHKFNRIGQTTFGSILVFRRLPNTLLFFRVPNWLYS